jgi:hypothetical protein
MSSQLKDGRPQPPSNVPGSTTWKFEDVETFAGAVRQASDAVTTLADRLNALALRIALLGSAAGAENDDLESYLVRLYSLVDSAGSQMRLIQNLLPVLQGALPRGSRADSEIKESN